MHDLTLYYSPSCASSAGAVSFLLLRGYRFRLVNVDEHGAERARLGERHSGALSATPVLEIDGELHVAPSLKKMRRLLDAREPVARRAA
jgi:hypothetical protein